MGVHIAAVNAADGVFAQPEAAFQLADLFLIHGDLAVSNVFCAAVEILDRAIKADVLLYRERGKTYNPCPGGLWASYIRLRKESMCPMARRGHLAIT